MKASIEKRMSDPETPKKRKAFLDNFVNGELKQVLSEIDDKKISSSALDN